MKKYMLLGVCAALALAVAGCGSSDSRTQAGMKVLRVATDTNARPYNIYLDESKEHKGFDVELMDALAQKMGYDKVEYVNVECKDLLVGLNQRKYDAAIAGITITRRGRQMVDFSDSYADAGLKVVVPTASVGGEGAAFMKGKVVAGRAGGTGVEMARRVNAAEIIEVGDIEDALKLVVAGKADCAVAEGTAMGFFLNNGYGEKLKFAGSEELNYANMGIAVGKGNKELLDRINVALAEVRESGAYKKVYDSYFKNI